MSQRHLTKKSAIKHAKKYGVGRRDGNYSVSAYHVKTRNGIKKVWGHDT